MLTTRDGPAVIDATARYWAENRDFFPRLEGPYRNIALTFQSELVGDVAVPVSVRQAVLF